MASPVYAVIKRCLDVVLSFVFLAFLWPFMVLIGVVIRCETEGGALFRQERVGQNGRPFVCLKFRTMVCTAPSRRPTATFPDAEQYVTRVGRFLRRYSLDELPQLFNVLCGQMSLVGPRPLLEEEMAVHRMRRANGASCLRPGLTGLAQIRGRDLLDDVHKARLDGQYYHRIGLRTDAYILWRTVLCVMRGDGLATKAE